MPEQEIVHRAQTLDEDALAHLYKTYYPKVFNYGFAHLGDVQAAEDLASEVMVKVAESIQRYRFTGAPFSAWVFRIARNRLIDLSRRRKRRREVRFTEWAAAEITSPHCPVESALDRQQLQLALQHLNEDQRQVIVLRFFEGFDIATAGRILNRSQCAVKSLQHRALNSLRRRMPKAA